MNKVLIIIFVLLFVGILLLPKPTIAQGGLSPIKVSLESSPLQIIDDTTLEVASNHEYKIHQFDCTEFSKELMERLRHQNFDAYCVFGILKNPYSLHTWVEVEIDGEIIPIESTGGFTISDEEYKNNYIPIKRRGRCL